MNRYVMHMSRCDGPGATQVKLRDKVSVTVA